MADSLALLEDGSVWAWGSNMDGQLGTCGQAPSSNALASELSEQPEEGTRAVQSCAARLSSGRPDPFRCWSSAVQQPATTPHTALITLLQTGKGIANLRGESWLPVVSMCNALSSSWQIMCWVRHPMLMNHHKVS